jgi:hypothetical protein
MESPVNGQWMGGYSGTNTGLLVIDIDQIGETFDGLVSAYNSDAKLPAMRGPMPPISKGQSKALLRVPLSSVERDTANVIDGAELSRRYPGVGFPAYADTEWDIGSEIINIKWVTDIGTSGSAKLTKSVAGRVTELSALEDVVTC